ncbi:DUF4102 domain-containing protein [Sphingomonas populi]|uniref:DUF4102 domain-containing protein n=1 Tax=Sphingomonas populi TaxID=2484750 RepID=A0A4Q6XV95_9SPHN|nr:integrase arm-type DNA-binding domain-containing protein [Sphingomonas populi]RZF64260.1 DUF4102 domain-containing protein [Sphingomonas populi]
MTGASVPPAPVKKTDKLSALACQKAAPREKPYKLSDGKGLYLEVLPSGVKSWRWKYRIGPKEKRLVFGTFPDVKLSEARELREDAARQLRQGIDPSVHKVQRAAEHVARAGSTFETVARDWYASQAPAWSKRYAKIVIDSLEKDVFPKIGKLPIRDVTTPLVLKVLRPIEQRGAVETAHRVRQRISEVFALAVGSGIADGDPAAIAGKALGKVRKRQFPAVRSIEAAREVLEVTEAQPGHPLTKLASRLLALTSVRSQIVRGAIRSEFEDLDGAEPLWRVPAARMKLIQERKDDPAMEFLVPLSRQAVAVLRAAMTLSNGPLIFRSVRLARNPISDATISKVYREAGLSGKHVPHGWRSTFSTIMNELAEAKNRVGDRAIIDLMLAHVQQGVEATYNRAAYMPRRREIAQEWADMLTEGLAPPESLLDGPRQRPNPASHGERGRGHGAAGAPVRKEPRRKA